MLPERHFMKIIRRLRVMTDTVTRIKVIMGCACVITNENRVYYQLHMRYEIKSIMEYIHNKNHWL